MTGEVALPGASRLAGDLSKAIVGGTPVFDEDYADDVRHLSPVEVADIARELSALTPDTVRTDVLAREHLPVVTYKYGEPANWEMDLLNGLIDSYSRVRDFYLVAAKQRDAVFIWLEGGYEFKY